MAALNGNARTAETYLAGLGASGALIAGAVVAFLLLVGMVTFDAWPRAAGLLGGEDAAVSSDAEPGAAAAAALGSATDQVASATPGTPLVTTPGRGGAGQGGTGGNGGGTGGGTTDPGGTGGGGSTGTGTGTGGDANGAGALGDTVNNTVNGLGKTVNDTVGGVGKTVNDTVGGLGKTVNDTVNGVNGLLGGLGGSKQP